MGVDQGTRVRDRQGNRAELRIVGWELTTEPGSRQSSPGNHGRAPDFRVGTELTREPGSELTRKARQSSPGEQSRAHQWVSSN